MHFNKLVDRCKKETEFVSSMTEVAINSHYQRIIGIGPDCIPLLLEQLRNEGDDPFPWFWALRVLSGVDPVPESDRGSFRLMSKAWLQWGCRYRGV
jgi:hypothetical protein